MCKVSIIVPIYNVDLYICECLDSLINQTLTEIEIICINDGSTDSCGEILKEYLRNDNRVRLITQENHGLSYSRNKGMEMARGEYIYFCDGDDYLCTDAMFFCYKYATDNNLDVIRFGSRSFDSENPDHFEIHEQFETNGIISGIEFLRFLSQQKCTNPGTPFLFIKKEFLDKYNYRFINGIIHEDHSFFLELMLTAQRVCHIPNAFYNRRIRKGSIMQTQQYFKSANGFLKTLKYFLVSQYENEKLRQIESDLHLIFKLFLKAYDLVSPTERMELESEIKEVKILLKKRKYLYDKDMWFFCIINTSTYFYARKAILNIRRKNKGI